MPIEYELATSDQASQWNVTSSGSDHYLLIDDPVGTPDDDTTYVDLDAELGV